jgi:MFS family permease
VVRERGPWLGVAALCLVQFVDVLGVTVVVAALPVMIDDLGGGASAGGLVATGYAMFFGGLLMVGARLGDRFGHRRVILVGLALFAVAAVLGATARSVPVLTAARCLQGAAAAASVPGALRLLTTLTLEGRPRQRALAAWSAAGATAGAAGFVVGGVVTDLTSWRVVFWGYLPLAGLLAAGIRSGVPAGPAGDRTVRLGGASPVLFTAAAMAFVVATTLLPAPGRTALGIGLLATAGALAVAFAVADRRTSSPLLPRVLLAAPTLRQGLAGSALNTLTTSSAITLATLFLQNARGLDPLTTGLLFVPFSLGAVAGSALAAPVLSRLSPRLVVAVGLTAVAVFDATLPLTVRDNSTLIAGTLLGGLGLGLSSVAANGLGTSVEEADRGTASGVLNTAAQMGTAVGIAVVLLAATLTTGSPQQASPVPAPAWLATASVALTGALWFVVAERRGAGRSSPRPVRTG